jgi:hypothetical protein
MNFLLVEGGAYRNMAGLSSIKMLVKSGLPGSICIIASGPGMNRGLSMPCF